MRVLDFERVAAAVDRAVDVLGRRSRDDDIIHGEGDGKIGRELAVRGRCLDRGRGRCSTCLPSLSRTSSPFSPAFTPLDAT